MDEGFKNVLEAAGLKISHLEVSPPFIWPDGRVMNGMCSYETSPPFDKFTMNPDLIAGVLVGPGDQAVAWIEDLTAKSPMPEARLVLVLYEACPTREHHLRTLAGLQGLLTGFPGLLQIRLLPIFRGFGEDYERATLPPTMVLSHKKSPRDTVLCIGSIGEVGRDPANLASFNLVLRPDDALADAWRRWFQFVFSNASLLTDETACIPYLIPPKGDPRATELWNLYRQQCALTKPGQPQGVVIDPETGEVRQDAQGQPVVPWDGGLTALDPLAQEIQKIYAGGWLVTIDETTRLRPLTVPVKAALLGQQAETTIGAIKQKQSFSLQVLSNDVEKVIEKCRKVTDLIDLLTVPISQGNRWIPEGAKELLERELELRNSEGKALLERTLKGGVDAFVKSKLERIRKDLDEMYRQLGMGQAVPEDRVQQILAEVSARLTTALETRITPRAVYNRLSPPNLTSSAGEEEWRQPLGLLHRSACKLREALTDSFFERRFKGMSFGVDEFLASCNPFGDCITGNADRQRTMLELKEIDGAMHSDEPEKLKFERIWKLIRARHGQQNP